MRQNNAYDANYKATQVVQAILNGGTGASSLDGVVGNLGGVSKEALNRPGGLAVVGKNGRIDLANIPSNLVVGPTLCLRTALTAATQAQVEITNFDMATKYNLDIQPNCPMFMSGNSIYFTPPANGVYKLTVNGKETYYTVGAQKPLTPSIIYPTASLTGLSDQIVMVSAGYISQAGVPFGKAQWQISASATFATVFKDSGDVFTPADWLVQGLAANTVYYARLRQYDKSGAVSDWSATVSFQTAADFIADTNIGTYASTGRNAFGRRFVMAPNESAIVVYDPLYKNPLTTAAGYDGSLTVFNTKSTLKFSEILFKRDNFPVEVDDCSIAISDDGKVVALATKSFEKGSDKNNVHIYSLEDGILYHVQTLTNFDEVAGAATNHKLTVRLSKDGKYLAVGSTGTVVGGLTTGAVLIFFRNQGQYARQTVLTRTSAADGDRIGTAVAMSSEGDRVLYSRNPATGTNQNIYTSTRANTTWSAVTNGITKAGAVLADKFGAHIEMSGDGLYAAVSSPGATVSGMLERGSVGIYLFGSSWASAVVGGVDVSPTTLLASDKFGSHIRMSRNGGYLIVGVENMTRSGNAKAGGVFMWALSSATPVAALRELTPTTPVANLKFGACVALNQTGSALLVGECVYNDVSIPNSGPGKINRFR